MYEYAACERTVSRSKITKLIKCLKKLFPKRIFILPEIAFFNSKDYIPKALNGTKQ